MPQNRIKKTENAYELHSYQFFGVCLWRNCDNDDKNSTRVTRKIEKIIFGGIVW